MGLVSIAPSSVRVSALCARIGYARPDRAPTPAAELYLSGEIGYQVTSGTRLQATVHNVLNVRADDIRYSHRSRLRGEPAGGVDDTHFHPVEPRQLRASLEWRF